MCSSCPLQASSFECGFKGSTGSVFNSLTMSCENSCAGFAASCPCNNTGLNTWKQRRHLQNFAPKLQAGTR